MRRYVLQLPDVQALLVISAPLIVALAMLRGVLCYMLISHPFVVRAPAARTMCYSDTADQFILRPAILPLGLEGSVFLVRRPLLSRCRPLFSLCLQKALLM